MKLKEIKPGMVIHCKTQEEANNLCDAVGALSRWKEYWEQYESDTCYQILDKGIYSYGKNTSYKNEIITEFSDLILPEMTAEEAFSILGEIRKCGGRSCPCCPLGSSNNDGVTYCSGNYGVNVSDGVRLLEICQQWKSDHEKKEPEIETVDICRIIEVLPDGRKRCVYEEDMEMGPDFPTGEEWIEIEKILKRYCMENDGEFIAVHETVSRVKQVAGKLETHGNARNRTCALLD